MITRRDFLGMSAGAAFAFQADKLELGPSVPPTLDHIILGCNDLDKGVAYLEKLSGYRAAFGGSHPGRGTCNALLKIGHHSYLEILAPDPQQGELAWHQDIASMSEPLLVGWAIRQSRLDSVATNYRKKGINVIGPISGSRTRPDGEILRWTVLMRADDRAGLLPFFIDWDSHSKHPSDDAPGGCLLTDFRRTGTLMEMPPPGPNFQVAQSPDKPAQLRATIAGLLGEFVLTSRSIPSEYWVKR